MLKAEGKRQKVSHCGGRVSRHEASGEPEGQKNEFIFPIFFISSAPLYPAPWTIGAFKDYRVRDELFDKWISVRWW